MGRYIKIGTVILVILLSFSTYSMYNKIQNLKEKLSVSISNEKAFIKENNALKDKNRAFKFTIEQLEYFNDSLTVKMNDVRKQLRIKDRDLNHIQYLLSEAQKKDTIVLKDTIISNPKINIDTTIFDKWHKVNIGIKYPNVLTYNIKFISEKYIVTHYKKETIKPPKKFFLWRLFQKKHKILEVEVVEKNPYIENKQQRFIEILK